MNLTEILKTNRLILDGAMGSMLQKYGLAPGQGGESANLTNKQAVMQVHSEYLHAGANIITANTFGAYSHHYDNWEALVTAGISHAKEAAQNHAVTNTVRPYVALDMGPTGKLLKPVGDADFDECYSIFKQTAAVGIKAGADLVIIETMTDLYELKAVLLAVQDAREEMAKQLPIIATVSFDASGYTMMGSSVENMAVLLESLGADALGMNCGFGPDIFAQILPALTACTNLPIVLQPNAGLPEIIGGETVYSLSPEEFAEIMAEVACEPAVRIFGGCCGTTPEHIRAMAEKIAKIPTEAPAHKQFPAAVSSATQVVRDYDIGKSALSPEHSLDERIDEACDLADEHNIVEVFLRVPEEVLDFQEVVQAPLLLRAEEDILAQAARLYNGVPFFQNKPAV